MKKITLMIAILLSSVFGFSQTTVTIGTGTTASGTTDNGNPIYRSSQASTYNFSQSVQLLKSTDLSAAGVTGGATITKIAYYKTSAFTLTAGRTANLQIYLKNSGATTLVTTQNMATWTTGATLGYSNPAISSAEIPAAAGWVEFTLTTPFNYTGGAIEVALDWKGDTTAASLTDGAFLWQYTAGTAGQAVGTSNNAAITTNLASTQARQYNTQLTFTNSPCSGTPAPGNTLASNATPCPGSNVTFSLQNSTNGSGVTYQWYNNAGMIAGATNPSYTGAIVTADSYYCNVTCSGATTASTAVPVAPLAAISTFPWIENFDSLTTLGLTNFPSCWTKENGDWASANATTYNSAFSGANYIRDSYSATNEYIWTQAFQLTAGTSYDFSTFVQGDGYTGWVVDYFYNTTANSVGATQLGASYNVPGSGTIAIQPYNKVTQSFTPTTTGVYFFGVRVNQPSSTPWYVALDNFEVKLTPAIAPSCATNFVATPNATCGNEATAITWTAAPNANGYNITMGTTMGGTNILNNVNIGSSASYNFVGNPGTTYYYTIVPFNGVGTAVGCTENTFSTFATGCYCVSNPTSNDGSGITNVQLATTNFATTDVTYFDHTATSVNLPQAINTNVKITFATGYTYNTYIWIDLNNNNTFETSELLFGGESLATNPTVLDASFVMPASAALGMHRMRIVTADAMLPASANPCYSGSYGVTLDFTVNVVAPPTCVPPTALTATSITATSANLGWTQSGTAAGWDIEWGTSGFTPTGTPNITGTTTNPHNLTGLSASTAYSFYVRANCGGTNGVSSWSGPFSFTTLCAVFTAPFNQPFATNVFPSCWMQGGATPWEFGSTGGTTPTGFADYGAASVADHTAAGGTFIGMDGSDNDNGEVSTLTSPLINVTALTAPRLTYAVFSNNTNDAARNTLKVEVYDGAAWNTVNNITDNLGANWVPYITDLSTLTITGPIQIRYTVTGVSNGGFTFYNDILIDDVIVEQTPSCISPTVLTATAITTVSANLGWTQSGTTATWDIEWGTSGFVPTGTPNIAATTTNPHNLTGLTPNTNYCFYVRANCGSTAGVSTWSGPFCFTTACSVANVPYVMNFETATVPALPNCTMQQNVGTGNLWSTANNPGYGFTTKALRYSYNGANAANVWFYTQGLNLTAGTTYAIAFDYGSTGTTFPEKLKVAYGTSANAAAMTNSVVDFSSVVNATPLNSSTQFTPTTTGVYYFGFNAYSDANQFYLLVDNINVEVFLNTNSFDNASFSAYPNPVKDVLNLSYSSEISSVKVINLLGQEVISRKVNNTTSQIDMTSLTAGAYIVNVTVGDTVKTIKVIKQ